MFIRVRLHFAKAVTFSLSEGMKCNKLPKTANLIQGFSEKFINNNNNNKFSTDTCHAFFYIISFLGGFFIEITATVTP